MENKYFLLLILQKNIQKKGVNYIKLEIEKKMELSQSLFVNSVIL